MTLPQSYLPWCLKVLSSIITWSRVGHGFMDTSRLSLIETEEFLCQCQWKSSPLHHLWILFAPCSANIRNDWSKKQTWTNQLTWSRFCPQNHAESNTRWWHLTFLLFSSCPVCITYTVFCCFLTVLLFDRNTTCTDNLISTRTCSCVCICRIALCPFMYSAVMWTRSCLVDVMWTCDEVGWPFGLEERDVSPFVPKACCAFCWLLVRY